MVDQSGLIFISYHRDDAEIARRIRDHLLSAGASTWMDEFDIAAGAYWPDEIDKGLAAAETVVGVLGPSAVNSRNVKNEWDWAIQNKKRLLLVQADSCVIPHRYVSINLIGVGATTVDAALASLSKAIGLDDVATSAVLPKTSYARAGDLSIAYQVIGESAVDLVLVPGYISHVEHYWALPGMVRFLSVLASEARLIMFDKRGTGLSDRISGISTLEERLDDIRAVMDAASSHRAVICGISEGGPLAALFAATNPDRTLGLVVYAGSASWVRQPDYPWRPTAKESAAAIDELAFTIHERWGTEQLAAEIIDVRAPSAVDDVGHRQWFATLMRLGSSPGMEIARQRMNLEIDVRAILPLIRVPSVVVTRTGDRDVLVEESRYVAASVPGARIVELPGQDHLPWTEDVAALGNAITQFVAEVSAIGGEPPEPGTSLMTALHITVSGVNAAAAERRQVEGLIDRAVKRFHGRGLVNQEGASVLLFEGPVRAIRCAVAVNRAIVFRGWECRCGVHIGEVMIGNDGTHSRPARIAGNLAASAPPGGIVVSGIVRDIVAGSGIQFAEHGKM